ncbi:5-hydroxytryptamine receptor 2A-like [Podarcis raffonei]|uniref:5-hydroxytryptamine receptor 2C isoform X1 n=1 Tax=Podarcis lilfordi TaxID=74358 RepID=A0AA35PQL4_9SAUR|nr:5-hydroxytryptamine receptor 2A-like [Podarcis raffonei]XP_053229571.1 5-hydroxytryptamine receptor 2A-like [Podarcis raffonei]XP_053229572.1 5-hydroxytryptamine receptor 2A-like [Podarcis raffonei]XP_053229573.1 5-hydroxytryptamine receptor 2A-like [Podarcis raffonei]XP_053229574.1 5-hydroxytryptamine receptor 2A-like [Podarcis raffonei]XP_053229575.1 5-hydroxytryptamine receptor 2A-like [Podarcis raffonei]XP_053229576.1 5-hydroxytryptamine receptor 2A-like [Podarcis raffonei]XP_05322957
MMSATNGAGVLVGLTTVSVPLDFSPHSGLMSGPLSHNLTLNQTSPTSDPLNVSEGAAAPRKSIGDKNWPALLILIIILLTIGGNILVIMAVSLEKKLQNATNYFLMSLAVADMLVGILVMPVSLITILYDYAWPLPKQLCPIWISLDVLFSTASIMHLCAISLDRYVAIRNPIEHSRFNSRTKAIMKIAAVWTISIGISLPIPVIGLQDDSRVFVNGSCVLNDENFVLIGSFVAFFIPLIIMVFAYCLTIQVLQKQASVFLYGEAPKQRRSSMSCLKKENNTENLSMLQNHEAASHLNSPVNKEGVLFRKGTMQSINNERRASKVLGIVFFLFLIMWCPFFITNIMSVLCKEACDEALLGELLDVFVWVGYICSGVNPLVYTLFNKIYRRAFSNYIRCRYNNGKKSAQRHNQCPNVSTTALYGKDLNLNSYRNGNELNSMEMDETEDALEMHVGTSELSINNCSGKKTSSV